MLKGFNRCGLRFVKINESSEARCNVIEFACIPDLLKLLRRFVPKIKTNFTYRITVLTCSILVPGSRLRGTFAH